MGRWLLPALEGMSPKGEIGKPQRDFIAIYSILYYFAAFYINKVLSLCAENRPMMKIRVARCNFWAVIASYMYINCNQSL